MFVDQRTETENAEPPENVTKLRTSMKSKLEEDLDDESEEENVSIPTGEINKKTSEEYDNTDENVENDAVDTNCKDEMAKHLMENNDKICEYVCNLKNQRDELIFLIEKQYDERKKLETEMERITYKLCLINKSMAQRIKTKNMYDQTLEEIETIYTKLVQDSEVILALIQKQYENLDGMINKKTSTDETLLASPIKHAGGEHHTKICNCYAKRKDRSRNCRNKCTCNNTINQEGDSD